MSCINRVILHPIYWLFKINVPGTLEMNVYSASIGLLLYNCQYGQDDKQY